MRNARYAFVKANWHSEIVDRSLDGFREIIPADSVDVFDVPGAFELPLMARDLSMSRDRRIGAIASSLAGEIYGLNSLAADIEDAAHNTTRFVILSAKKHAPRQGVPCVTSFIFEVQNVPAALYKALGGFAINGVNMVRLESYQKNGSFRASQFYADILGHPKDANVKQAMKDLKTCTRNIKVLGTYPQHPFRRTGVAGD
jgi:prephenate dehydratase